MTQDAQNIKPAIPQHVLVLRDFCIRTHGCKCTRCTKACPAGAIEIVTSAKKAAPTIDAKACTHCCVCLGVCDAFTATQTTLVGIYSHARRIALSKEGREVVFTCSKCAPNEGSVASNVIVVGCLAALPAQLWLQLLACNTNMSIALEMGLCESCKNNKGIPSAECLIDSAISSAEAWSGSVISFCDDIPKAADESLLASLVKQGHPNSRRGMFSGVFNQFKDVASGDYRRRTNTQLSAHSEEVERRNLHNAVNITSSAEFNKYAPLGRVKITLFPRRKMLLEAINIKPEIAENVCVSVPKTDEDLCDGCLVCTRFCPTGARFPNADNGALEFKVHLCIGCKMCENVCKKHAVEFEETTVKVLLSYN